MPTNKTPGQVETIRFISACHNVIMAQSISQLVTPYADFQCVATCATANEVVDAINKHKPHIVLMGGNWLEGFRQANSKLTRSLSRATNWAIVDPRVEHHIYVEATQLGIHYLFETPVRTTDDFIDRIRFITREDTVQRDSSNQTKCTMPIPRDETDETILSLLTAGWTNKQIANQACLSIQTVKNRLSRMMKQSGAANRTELVVRIVG